MVQWLPTMGIVLGILNFEINKHKKDGYRTAKVNCKIESVEISENVNKYDDDDDEDADDDDDDDGGCKPISNWQ